MSKPLAPSSTSMPTSTCPASAGCGFRRMAAVWWWRWRRPIARRPVTRRRCGRSTRPAGGRPPRSDGGEWGAAFTPAGDLLFTSARPANQNGADAEADGEGEEPRAALWLQPATGGDARVVANLPGGVQGLVVSESGALV